MLLKTTVLPNFWQHLYEKYKTIYTHILQTTQTHRHNTTHTQKTKYTRKNTIDKRT